MSTFCSGSIVITTVPETLSFSYNPPKYKCAYQKQLEHELSESVAILEFDKVESVANFMRNFGAEI